MAAKPVRRNRGALLLAQVGESQKDIAARVGCHQVEVCYYTSGQRRPGHAKRIRLQREYGIPVDAWDEALAAPVAVPLLNAATVSLADGSVLAYAQRLKTELDRQLELVLTSEASTPREKIAAIEAAADTARRLAQMTGESLEIPRARFMRLPRWRRIESVIVRTLEPWPDAMRAVGDALNAMDDD